MTRLLTPEERAERYCLQQCPGGCIEPHSPCLQKPGHLHRHSHGVYDYLGSGQHTWEREQPNTRELAAFLKAQTETIVVDGKTYIGTEHIAAAVVEYLKSFQRPKPKKRGLFGLR